MPFSSIGSDRDSYTFTVYCRDAGSGILNSSIKTGSIRVIGPSFNKVPSLISKSPATANSNFITATYSLSGPFSSATNGLFSILAIANQTSDVVGNKVPESVIGTFECAIQSATVEPPSITFNAPLGTLYTDATAYYAAVQATDTSNLIDSSGLVANNLRLLGSDGSDRAATAITLVKNDNESSVFILASWDGPFEDGVTYSVRITGGIRSKTGIAIAAQTIPGSITAQPPISTGGGGGLNVDFRDGTHSAIPAGWVVPAGIQTAIVSDGLRVFGGTQGGWIYDVKSPLFQVKAGLTLSIVCEKIQNLAVFGITSNVGDWGSFSNNDVLIYGAGSGVGSLHTGQAEIANDTGYDPTSANRLTFAFGSSTMQVSTAYRDTDGSFVSTFSISLPIPDEFSDGIRVLISPHDNGEVFLSSITSTSANTAPLNVLAQRTVPDEFFGYNGAALAIADWNTVDKAKFGGSTQRSGASILRFPGGDESNFWDYTRNGLITNSEDILPLAPWHSHGRTLPIHLAYQIEKTTATPANLKQFFTASGSPRLIWCTNCTTSSPEKEILAMQALEAAGHTITDIELGNELFFNVPYYTGDAEHPLRGHTSPSAFATDMIQNWIPAMRSQWPNAKVYVLGTPDYSFQFGREANWNYALKDAGCFEPGKADGLTIHPYYSIENLNIDKSAVGSVGRASVAGKLAHAELANILNSRSLEILPEGIDIACTEFSVLEDRTQTGFVVFGQTWAQSLIQVQNVKIMLRDRRCSMALLHSLLSNPQWEGVCGESGTAMDPAKRGFADEPFTQGIYPPLTETMQGFLLGIFANNALNGGGEGYLLADSPGYMAWRIKSATRDRISITNTTADVHVFAPPLGSGWAYEQWSNPPWFDVTDINQVPDSTTGAIADGGVMLIPAFTQIILSGDGTANITGRVQPPSIVLTPPSSRVNGVRLLVGNQIGTIAPVSVVNLVTVRPT